MRIAFVWYWDRASQILPNWRDGLRGAIEHIEKTHDVDWYLDLELPEDEYDGIIIWGDSDCPAIEKLKGYSAKVGICLTTNPHNPRNLIGLDAIYCESQPVYEEVRRLGLRAIKAFGTDTDFFKPDESVERDIEYFYPATFSPWKKQSAIANLGDKLLCVGTVQPDGHEELEACRKSGVSIITEYIPVELIKQYYNRTRKIIIPAIHGSERTVLEAMAMNILPTVAPENRKAHSYLNEYRQQFFDTTRDFILANYSHRKYAEALLKGLE